jgi:hypothetical protein
MDRSEVLPQEMACGCPQAVDGDVAIVPQVDGVQVGLEDAVLRVPELDQEGNGRLPKLSRPGPFG